VFSFRNYELIVWACEVCETMNDVEHCVGLLCYRSAAATQVGELHDCGPDVVGLQTHHASVGGHGYTHTSLNTRWNNQVVGCVTYVTNKVVLLHLCCKHTANSKWLLYTDWLLTRRLLRVSCDVLIDSCELTSKS